jgi:hypothetical protein
MRMDLKGASVDEETPARRRVVPVRDKKGE